MFGKGTCFLQPEIALKRVHELEQLGDKRSALQILYDIILSRNIKILRLKSTEDLINKYLNLCIELNSVKCARDGLIYYRNICLQTNVCSLEEVTSNFLTLVSNKFEEYRLEKETIASALFKKTKNLPENLVLPYTNENRESDTISSCSHFLWEFFRIGIEIYRNNTKLEGVLISVINRSLDFCLKYKRSTEFYRLCDILQKQLSAIIKFQPTSKFITRDRPDLTSNYTATIYLKMRADLMNAACSLKMWQSAFSLAEEIYGIITISKKMPPPIFMLNYYSRLAEVFQNTGNVLYHANALARLFLTLEQVKELSLEKKRRRIFASASVLAIIAAQKDKLSFNPGKTNIDHDYERHYRVNQLLFHEDLFQHFSVITDKNIHHLFENKIVLNQIITTHSNLIFRQVLEIHELILGNQTSPLDVCNHINTSLIELFESSVYKLESTNMVPLSLDLSDFVTGIQVVAVLQTLRRLLSFFNILYIDYLNSLVPFMTIEIIEKNLESAIKFGILNVKLDHKSHTILRKTDVLNELCVRNCLSTFAVDVKKAASSIMLLLNKGVNTQCLATRECRSSLYEVRAKLLSFETISDKPKELHKNFITSKAEKEIKTTDKIPYSGEHNLTSKKISNKESMALHKPLNMRLSKKVFFSECNPIF
jgi:translation initiation factor 3 subunit A